MRLVSDNGLITRLEALGGRGRPGAARLRSVLAAVLGQAPAEYALEVKVARLLRNTELPPPVRQYRIHVFGRQYRLDFVWPHLRIALECDGRQYHEFQRDRTRWRHLGASGWRVLPVTWLDVTRRWPTIEAELRAALASAA